MAAQRVMGIEDDAHVFTLLRAHLFGYEDFVTLQYLCGQAYNLMPTFALSALSTSLVLPLGCLVLSLLLVKVLLDWRDAVHTDPAMPYWFAQVVLLCSNRRMAEGSKQVASDWGRESRIYITLLLFHLLFLNIG